MPWILTANTVAGNRTVAINLDRVAALAHDDKHLLVDLCGEMNSCLPLHVDPKPGPETKGRAQAAIAGFAFLMANGEPGRADHRVDLPYLIALGLRCQGQSPDPTTLELLAEAAQAVRRATSFKPTLEHPFGGSR